MQEKDKKDTKKPTTAEVLKRKQLEETRKLKEKYFEYYDDVKSPSRGKEDW